MCGSHQQSVTCLCGKTWLFQQLQCSFSSNLFKAQWTLKNVYQLLKRHLAGSTDTCYVEKFDICKETRRSIFTFDGAAVSLEQWDQSGQNAQCLWWYQLSNMVANEWFLLVLPFLQSHSSSSLAKNKSSNWTMTRTPCERLMRSCCQWLLQGPRKLWEFWC